MDAKGLGRMQERNRPGTRKELGQVLVEGAFVKPKEVESAREIARRTGRKLSDILMEQQLLAPETLATVLSFQYGVGIVDLTQYNIQGEALALLPEQLVREHNVLPLAVEGDILTVAMEDPGDIQLIDTLGGVAGKTIKPVIPLHGGIRASIDAHYRLTTQIQSQISQAVTEAPVQREQQKVEAESELAAEAISQAPVVRALDMIVSQAVKDRASDIHIEPREDGIQVRYRIDGILHDAVILPKGVHSALVSRIKVMASMNIAERRRPQDGQFSTNVGGKDIDFRVATTETSNGEMVVLRILDKSLSVLQLAEVGMSPTLQQDFQRVLHSAFGMILVCGPTGSGKTTTLYASVGQVDYKQFNIMTIEDPVEYHFKGINQMQVNAQAEITFARGLRAIMRLDPDVILVGEIRDQETANVGVQAALTGHLVLSSIHANDAVGSLIRLIDLGVEPFLVTSSVIATLSQRLVRKVCPYCRAMRRATPEEAMAYQQETGEVRTDFYYGRGCNFCSQTGYLGRVGVYEMLPLTEQIRQLVTRQAPAAEIKAQALKEGMVTMRKDGMLKARDGITTPSEVIRNVFTIG